MNRMSSESHQTRLNGRVAIEMDKVNSKMDPMGRAIADYKERMSFIKYIADESHYKEVLSLVGKAKQTVHFLPFGLRRIPVWRGSSNVQTQ